MVMTFSELQEFSLATFLGYARNVPPDPAHIGARYLPDQPTDSTLFSYVRGLDDRPVMAHVMGYDAEAPIEGAPAEGQQVMGELPPIKRKRRIGEQVLQQFLMPRAGSADRTKAVETVYDIAGQLIQSVHNRVEWLRIKALSEPTLAYDEAGVRFEFDYSPIKAQLLDIVAKKDGTGATIPVGGKWDDPTTSTPLDDGMYIAQLMRDAHGVEMTEWVMSSKAANLACKSQQVVQQIRGTTTGATVVTRAELNALLGQYDVPPIVTYDATVANEKADGSKVTSRYLDPTRSFMVPAGGVGRTLWGPTAESRPLIGTPLQAQAPGVIAVTYGENEPPAEWVKAAAVAFPTMPDVDLLVQAKVLDQA